MRKRTLTTFALTLILGICACGSPSLQGSNNGTSEPELISTNPRTDTGTEPTTEPTTESIVEPTAESAETAGSDSSVPDTTESMEETEMTYEIAPAKPMVAITFDDGPNTTTTVQILDLLEEYDVRASFFVIGNNINDESGKVMKRAYDMGCEINNHSKTHSSMPDLTPEEIKAEIQYTSDKVKEITGEPTRFFRPPYIAVNSTMYEQIDMPFICGFGCNDWEADVTAKMRASKTLEQIQDGAIILLHDFAGNSATVEALKTIIPALKEQGYQLVTVSELFEAKGKEISGDDTNLYSLVK